MFSTLFLCALFVGDASAVAPHDLDGSEPVRIYTTHGQAQAAFRRTAPWTDFTSAEGAGWSVRADERTGTPHRMWGNGIDLGPLPDATAVETALRGFMARHDSLLGMHEQPPVRSITYDAPYDTWFVDFEAMRGAAPIWRAGLTFRIKHGNLVLVGAETYPNTPERGQHLLDTLQATEAAIAWGPAPNVEHTDAEVTAVWLPVLDDNLLVLRAVYEVRTSTAQPIGEWSVFVDGKSGEVVAWYNRVRHLSGQITAEHDARYPGGGFEVSPVPYAFIGNSLTDANGYYTVSGSSATAWIDGSPMSLGNQLGNQSLSVTGNAQWNQSNGSLAELDVWVHLNRVRDTYAVYSPNVSWNTGGADITVNINDVCNAYYVGGTMNFFQQGGGCNNTGRLADVIYHEWAHGLHDYSLVAGYFDGALSEGAGDVVAFLMTGDHQMAPGFFQGGSYLRDAQNTKRYPEDLVNEVHEDGLIFAGAMWDTYTNIENLHGTPAAKDASQHMLAGMLKAGVGLPGSLEETLLADDDDGNLGNGTPNECAIVAGFSAHGLGELGGNVGFVAGHEPIATADPQLPLSVAVSIVGPASCTGDFASGNASVTWRANKGSWQTTPLTVTGTDIQGAIPTQPFGTFVEYYIEVVGPQTLSAPTRAWRNPYSFYVGDVIPVRCDDFEANDGGYTHELVSGAADEGADDWQHGAPGGLAGDPSLAHSGSNAWGNDLAIGPFNGEYQNGKHNRLTGPTVQLGHYEQSFLHYWRWLNVEDGLYDAATIDANGTEVWSNVVSGGQDHHQDDQWAPQAVDLGNPSGSVQIAWNLSSDEGLAMGGWTLDDVCILAPATVNNRLGVTDFIAGEGEAGGVSLSWTTPAHAPVFEIRILRREGSCPTSVDDGEVVFYDSAPVLGAPASAFDAVPTTHTYCYGVFPGDGSSFLSFAQAGWNIDEGSASVAATPEEIEQQGQENGLDEFEEVLANERAGFTDMGCGCSGAGTSVVGGWLALLGLVVRRRRS